MMYIVIKLKRVKSVYCFAPALACSAPQYLGILKFEPKQCNAKLDILRHNIIRSQS